MALDEDIIKEFIATAGPHHFVSEVPAYLECSICQNILEEPVVCDNGSHTFCRKCLVDWMGRNIRPLCPIDREPLNLAPPRGPRRAPRALQDCIDALEVVCALGCGWKGGQGKWPDHLRRECPEVEDDTTPERQARSGSVPRAVREEERASRAGGDSAPGSSSVAGSSQAAAPLSTVTEEAEAHAEDAIAALSSLGERKTGAMCDACEDEIFNEVYMCTVCPDYDLCSECWHDGERSEHTPSHAFVKIKSRKDFYPGEREGRPPDTENQSRSLLLPRHRDIHWDITCDGCGVADMKGIRYNCTVCHDFDLCQDCVERSHYDHHDADHDMIRISKPRHE